MPPQGARLPVPLSCLPPARGSRDGQPGTQALRLSVLLRWMTWSLVTAVTEDKSRAFLSPVRRQFSPKKSLGGCGFSCVGSHWSAAAVPAGWCVLGWASGRTETEGGGGVDPASPAHGFLLPAGLHSQDGRLGCPQALSPGPAACLPLCFRSPREVPGAPLCLV